MDVNLALTGKRKMLHHNGRLANPLNEHTRDLKALTSKRKKTDNDLIEIMLTEARAGCWETEQGLIGIPAAAVWRSIYDAAKAFKLGEQVKRAFFSEDPDFVAPILIDGETVSCDAYLDDPAHIDYRPAKVGTAKVMRARPCILPGWEAKLTFELLEEVMDLRDLAPVFERAGSLVGLGDWRPNFGRYEIEIESTL